MRSITSCPEALEPVVAGVRTWRLPELDQGSQRLRVWLVAWPADPSDQVRRAWWRLLDEPERVRFGSIGTEAGKRRFAASHAAARLLVPEQRVWEEGCASLSHTGSLAAIACAEVRVGIDVEADVPRPRWVAADRQQWPGSPASCWPGFVKRWVQYEAAFKAGVRDGSGSCMVGRVRDLDGLPDHFLAVALESGTGGLGQIGP